MTQHVHASSIKPRFFGLLSPRSSSLLRPRSSSSSSSSSGGKVRVVARARPLLPSEIDRHGYSSCISFSDDLGDEKALHIKDTVTSREGNYKVDSFYGENDKISSIFANEVEPILPALFLGQNATVFAYGATGSGKTYTMQGLDEHPGLMPLAMTSILLMAEANNARVQVAYYEVYMERCFDLLEDKNTEVSILENNEGKIQLRGLSQVCVQTLDEFRKLFLNGCLRRKTGQTGLNDVSSRSHGILTVSVTNAENGAVLGKLNLIDLAGNEDNKRTGNDGIRLVESSSINQSLFALSNVINALNSNEPRVPYRDSKLTRILQDSLGGRTHAIMIACLNPRSYNEAAHTLSLATRSRQIVNPMTDKKDPQPKIDMCEKLKQWREAKGKAFPSMSTMGKGKPLFHTPSHHQINQLRRFERGISRDSPKARRVLIAHPMNSDREKKNGTDTTPTTDQKAKQHGLIDKEIQPHKREVINEKCYHIVELHGDRSMEDDASVLATSIIDKENDWRNNFYLTPSAKPLLQSSSPPLSERLDNLRAALRDVVQSIHDNDAILEKEPISTRSNVVCPMKPLQESLCTINMEESITGTPLQKLNMKSCGIKNTIAKEYIKFLNTASREELLAMKGIGEKRADYILSLREDSPEPLKEIEDLEKIGISKKQALSLFHHTARHIFFS